MKARAEGAPLLADLRVVPRHVAIIMDGNGRWAADRGLPRAAGHKAGTDNLRRIIEACVEYGVEILTLYAFSTENWQRPGEEVDALFAILSDVIDQETSELHAQGVQIRHLGTLDRVSPSLARRIGGAVALTEGNSRLILNIAFNYGGRGEIVRAMTRALAAGIAPDQITEDVIGAYLDTEGQPDPDLVIRTAGEMRLSNFLLWQSAYAEYWSTNVFWPDFDVGTFTQALVDYNLRQRRFGGLSTIAPARTR